MSWSDPTWQKWKAPDGFPHWQRSQFISGPLSQRTQAVLPSPHAKLPGTLGRCLWQRACPLGVPRLAAPYLDRSRLMYFSTASNTVAIQVCNITCWATSNVNTNPLSCTPAIRVCRLFLGTSKPNMNLPSSAVCCCLRFVALARKATKITGVQLSATSGESQCCTKKSDD